MPQRRLTAAERNREAEKITWFSVLVHARAIGNRPEATRAHAELTQRGVQVTFPRRQPASGRKAKGATHGK